MACIDDHLGPFCSEKNIKLSDILKSKQVDDPLLVLNNGIVFEMRQNLPSDAVTAETIQSMMRENPTYKNSNVEGIRKKIHQICEKMKFLRRKGNKEKINDYGHCEFNPPKSQLDLFDSEKQITIRKIQNKVKKVASENINLKRVLVESNEEIENLNLYIDKLESTVQVSINLLSNIERKHRESISEFSGDKIKLKKETDSWKAKYDSVSESLNSVTLKLNEAQQKLAKYNTRNFNKRQKRLGEKFITVTNEKQELEANMRQANQTLSDLTNMLNSKDLEIQTIQNTLNHSEELVKGLKSEKRKLLKRVSALKIDKKTNKSTLVATHEVEINQLKNEIQSRNTRIRELEQLNEILENDQILTFENGKYVNEVRECIMSLIAECNVSLNKVNDVIKIVLKNLTGKLPDRLPSMAVKSRLFTEAKVVAHHQIVDAMLADANPSSMVGHTLHSDATSTFFKHYQSFQVTLYNGTGMSIGLSEVGSGDSASVVESFSVLINELASTVTKYNVEKSAKAAKLITSITNTMSDQGSVNPLFNTALSEMRSKLLPVVIDRWFDLDHETRARLECMGNFFCKMHLIVNFATESDKCLKTFEQNVIAGGRNPHSSESGACRLVRTSAKALTPHGSEKAGVSSYWQSYLDEKGETNKIATFRANRFNILYYDAAALFYHRNRLIDFLNQWVAPNALLKSIEYDINEKIYIAEIRALGIIDKIITGPLWRLFAKDGSILSLNPYLKSVLEKFQKWGNDASPIFEGDQLFLDVEINKDAIYDALFADTDPELDSLTQMALEVLIHSILLILDRQAKDQLPGGKYADPSPELVAQASAVPKTNTISERDFGSLDMLLRMKPAASTTCYESIILWSNNKTVNWLNSLGQEDKNQVLDLARKKAPELQVSFVKRKNKIKEQKLEKLKEKQKKKEEKETKQRTMKIELTNEIAEMGGLWQSVDIDTKIQNLRERGINKISNLVLSQIKFHKEVLNSKGPKELFQKSNKKQTYSQDELIDNLKQILTLNYSSSHSSDSKSLAMRPINEIKENIDQIKENVMKRISNQREKRIIEQQKNLLPDYLSSPERLVHKRIKHRCRETKDDTQEQWFSAEIIKIDKNNINPLKILYEVHYDETPVDKLYSMNLLADMKKGDLIIVS